VPRPRAIDDAFVAARYAAHRACTGCPSPHDVAAWLDDALGFVVPELATRRFDGLDTFRAYGDALGERLVGLVHGCPDATAVAGKVADGFLGGWRSCTPGWRRTPAPSCPAAPPPGDVVR
jgi:hypothetical protein